jgi:hypothetical protein
MTEAKDWHDAYVMGITHGQWRISSGLMAIPLLRVATLAALATGVIRCLLRARCRPQLHFRWPSLVQ